ncbi:LacI family transcriptional regulator [Calidifontibacter sp. DB0510]|uniref:LacI family transcriptional regulator n=1 Tax=Metallococcus carri TaxID=1656884 RepID=A0A967B4L5_9MICO|nr:substrate-binding domain-containing protein [Metallococcus carri]NHN55527.1 LacI family transcriptional regulator [Metallococcus carri]NOP38289.1 substrate-binding domain-containing protein [Calidifontibacter sp. DB2511S]
MPGTRGSHRVTIVDVARAAGVSRQTVSNVINYPDRVAPATLATVERHIAELGFHPSRAASLLRRETAGAWGFELDTLGTRRLGNILDSFVVELTARAAVTGAHIMPFVASPSMSVTDYRDLLAGRHVDGFVIANTAHGDPRPAWLVEQGVPFAAFGRIWDDPTIERYADVDGGAGVRAAVRHLKQGGYGTIGFLGWPTGSPVGDDRRRGWLTESGGGPEATAYQEIDSAARVAVDLVRQVGKGGAIVCASDVLAAGVWRHLTEIGLVAGRDIGLVGFDDTDLAETIGLTSLSQPLAAVADHVLALLADEPVGAALLTPELVVRTSSIPQEPQVSSFDLPRSPDPAGSDQHPGGTA